MKERKFTEEFDAIKQPLIENEVSDYNEFKNKELLDKLRNKIIQNLIDNKNIDNMEMNEFIKTK